MDHMIYLVYGPNSAISYTWAGQITWNY